MECIAVGPYTISNSFTFNEEVLKQDPSLFMGSLDVDALFTSIPLEETIQISADSLFKDKKLVDNLVKIEFQKLLSCVQKFFICFRWCIVFPNGWCSHGLPAGT